MTKAQSHEAAGIDTRVSVPIYPSDIAGDRKIRACSPRAKGAWLITFFDILNESKTGYEITDDIAGWACSWSCGKAEARRIIEELKKRKPCNVTECHGEVTLTNRRLKRRHLQRVGWKERKDREREKGGGDPKRWAAIRARILKRDGCVCAYCGKKAITVDHITPKSRGGDESDENLVACCKSCNMKKGTRSLADAGMAFHASFLESHTPVQAQKHPPSVSVPSSVSVPTTKKKKRNVSHRSLEQIVGAKEPSPVERVLSFMPKDWGGQFYGKTAYVATLFDWIRRRSESLALACMLEVQSDGPKDAAEACYWVLGRMKKTGYIPAERFLDQAQSMLADNL